MASGSILGASPTIQGGAMSMSNQGRTPDSHKRLPIFASVGERSSKRVAGAILLLMVAAIAAVAAVIVLNSVG
jgi:hypothetical protein